MCQPEPDLDLLVDEEAQNKPELPNPRRGVAIIWFMIALWSSSVGNVTVLVTHNILKLIYFYFWFFGIIFVNIAISVNFYYIYYAYACGLHLMSYPIGRLAKFKMDVIIFIAALTLRLNSEFIPVHFFALVSYTIEYHAIRQLLHAPSDVGFLDMLVEIAMQCAIFCCGHDIISSLLVFTSCVGVILYRYFTYSDPFTTQFSP